MGKNKEDFDKYEMKLETLKDKFYNMVECGSSKDYSEIDAKELGECVDMLKDAFESCYYLKAAEYYNAVTDAMEKSSTEEKEYYMGKYLPLDEREWYGGRRYPMYYSNRGLRPGRGIYARMRNPRTGRYMYGGDGMYPEEEMMYEDYDPLREMEYRNGRMHYFDPNKHWDIPIDYYNGNGSNGMSGNNSGNSNNTSGNAYYGNTRDPREGISGMRRRMYMESKEKGEPIEKKQKELESYMNDLSNDVSQMISGASMEEKQTLKQKLTNLVSKIN